MEESGLRGRTCYWLAKYGKEKHYQMGTKMINIGLKTQNQSRKQNPTTFSGGNEKMYLQWRRRRHGGENVRGQYSVSHTTETKNNTAKWGQKRKIFGSKLLNQSTNQNPTTFSGGKRTTDLQWWLSISPARRRRTRNVTEGRRGVRAGFRKKLTSVLCQADVI